MSNRALTLGSMYTLLEQINKVAKLIEMLDLRVRTKSKKLKDVRETRDLSQIVIQG